MEIDPDVAALLDDLPPSPLPSALTEAGWGRESMQHAMAFGAGRTVHPSVVQQPTYDDNCAQCGRPITRTNHGWFDHARSQECDSGIMDRETWYHISAKGLDDYRQEIQAENERRDRLGLDPYPLTPQSVIDKYTGPVPPRQAKPKAAIACSANKHSHAHEHQCNQADWNHFGFHECKFCHYLWR